MRGNTGTMQLSVRTILAAASLMAASSLVVAADETQTAEQRWKNIQVLKGIPASELNVTMNFIAGALGVRCNYCHTPTGLWPQGYEKDDLKPKQIAREMIRMTRQINETSFAGRVPVTCATCHGGHTRPAAFVAADPPEAVKALAAQPARPDTALPAPEELFARYESAIGGEAAIAKLATRHLVGTINVAGQTIRVEQFATSQGLFLQKIITDPQTVTTGFDGMRAYAVVASKIAGDSVTTVTGPDEDAIKLGALFLRDLRLQEIYAQAHTLRKEKLGGRDVYVVNANLKLERYSDLLYFDADSALLLRRTTLTRTPLGAFPQTYDFENYREIAGVRIATDQVRSAPGAPVQRLHIDEVRFNQPIDDAKFAMPPAPPK